MEKVVTEVRARHILVSTEEEINKVREEILNGKDFGHLAKRCSKCPSGLQGGDLGFFGKGMMVKEFEEVCFTLPVGEISEPVKTQFGWHLIMVTDQR